MAISFVNGEFKKTGIVDDGGRFTMEFVFIFPKVDHVGVLIVDLGKCKVPEFQHKVVQHNSLLFQEFLADIGYCIAEVINIHNFAEEIDLATAPRGTYVVVVTTKNETVTKKIVR